MKPAHLLKKNIGHGGFFMSLYLLDDLQFFFEGWEKIKVPGQNDG